MLAWIIPEWKSSGTWALLSCFPNVYSSVSDLRIFEAISESHFSYCPLLGALPSKFVHLTCPLHSWRSLPGATTVAHTLASARLLWLLTPAIFSVQPLEGPC